MRLYLVRHAQPEIAPGICYGSSDIGVSATENARVYDRLQRLLPPVPVVFSSPLRRCVQLAALVAPERYIVDARLRELDFGDWELRTWESISRTEIDAWANDLVNFRPGGGESVLMAARRIHAFHDAMRWLNCDTALAICHAGTIRLLMECSRAGSIENIAWRAATAESRISYGEVLVLEYA